MVALEKAFRAADELPAISVLPLEKCSARKMKPRVYDSTVAGKVPKKPDSMIGWQDMKQLAELSEGYKQAIRKLQAEHGLELTNFP